MYGTNTIIKNIAYRGGRARIKNWTDFFKFQWSEITEERKWGEENRIMNEKEHMTQIYSSESTDGWSVGKEQKKSPPTQFIYRWTFHWQRVGKNPANKIQILTELPMDKSIKKSLACFPPCINDGFADRIIDGYSIGNSPGHFSPWSTNRFTDGSIHRQWAGKNTANQIPNTNGRIDGITDK